jgi:WD40 repeat protein
VTRTPAPGRAHTPLGSNTTVPWFASALAFSPDGTRLALGGRSRLAEDAAFVRLWDVREQKLLGGTEGGGHRVNCLAFAGDGTRLATGDENGKVRLFDGLTGAVRQDFEGHGPLRPGGEQCVTGVGFAPDGKTFVSASADQTVKLWNAEGHAVAGGEGLGGDVPPAFEVRLRFAWHRLPPLNEKPGVLPPGRQTRQLIRLLLG